MFAYITGTLAHKDHAEAIIEAAGVGYLLKISLQTFGQLPAVNEKAKLFTFVAIREDAHTLFGFADKTEKVIFEDLISVSGIGPATALVMLSSLSSAEIKRALATEDLKTIQSVKGIGAKTAQRAIVELKDKMKKEALLDGTPATSASSLSGSASEAVAALVALGIPKNVAEKSVDTIVKRESEALSVEQLIKMALR